MNKHIRIIISFCVLALVLVSVILYTKRDDVTNQNDLKIGLIIPLTGDFGGVGENVRKGIMTAQSLFEKQNGIKIPVIVEDDSADVVKGLSAYKKLVEIDKVNGLINTFTSTMDAIYDAVNNRDYPVMMEFFQANNVADDKVFQMTLGNDHVWDRYAKFIASSDLDQSKVALVYSVDAAQSSFAKAFEDAYGKEVTKFVVGSDKDGLRADAIKVASVKPNLIVFFMTPENGAIMTKNILPLIASTTKLAYDIQLTTGMSYYEQLLGGDLSKINGAIALMFEGDTNSNEYKEFLSEYQKLYPNEQPGFLADYGYDTFMTYVRTFSSNNVKWRENLKNFSGSGASGAIEFDENGVRISPLVIKTVEDGKLVTTERLP